MRRIFLAALAILPLSCAREPSHEAPAAPPAPVEAGYVGPKTCATCHREIAATYAKTGMGRSWYPLEATGVVEDFEKHNVVEFEGSGLV